MREEGVSVVKPAGTTKVRNYQKRRRFWRWRAWRHRNPLRRTFTPVERLAALAVAALAVVLLAATGLAASASSASAEHSVRNTHIVNGVLTSTEPSNPGLSTPEGGMTTFTAHVRWNWQGADRSTEVPVLLPPPDGSAMNVRVDDAGQPVDDPWSSNDPTTVAIATCVSGFLFSATILACVLAWMRHWLLRRRAELWQNEWARIAPLWNGRGI
jgi:hypothetical protein